MSPNPVRLVTLCKGETWAKTGAQKTMWKHSGREAGEAAGSRDLSTSQGAPQAARSREESMTRLLP